MITLNDKIAITFEVEKINTMNNNVVNELKRILPILNTFVGQKIRLANGEASKKFDLKIIREDFTDTKQYTFNGYFDMEHSTLYVNFKQWMPKPDTYIRNSANSAEIIALGTINSNGELISVKSLEDILEYNRFEILTPQNEIDKVQNYIAAKKEAERMQKLIKVDSEIYRYF